MSIQYLTRGLCSMSNRMRCAVSRSLQTDRINYFKDSRNYSYRQIRRTVPFMQYGKMVFSRIWKRRTGLQINGMSQWSQRKQERLFIHMRLQMESRRVLLAWMVKSMRSRMYIHVHIMTRMHILIPACVTCGMICIRMKRKLQCGRKQRKMLWRGWI